MCSQNLCTSSIVGASGGQVGLAISLALGMTFLTDMTTGTYVEADNLMASVERLLEYTKIEQEVSFVKQIGKLLLEVV